MGHDQVDFGAAVGAGEAVRHELERILRSDPECSRWWRGCVDGNDAPGLTLGEPEVSDWGTKTERGRACRTRMTLIYDPSARPKIARLIPRLEAAGETLSGALGGGRAPYGVWRVASAVLLRCATRTLSSGRVRTQVEHRIRVLVEAQGP